MAQTCESFGLLFKTSNQIFTFDLFDFNDSKKPPPAPPDGSDRIKNQNDEARRLASVKARGGTLLTGGMGLDDDEDIIKKKTLLGA